MSRAGSFAPPRGSVRREQGESGRHPFRYRLPLSCLALLLLSACLEPRRLPAPPPPTPIPVVREEVIPAPARPQVEITDLQEHVTEDGKRVTVTGTLINRGTGTTSELTVTVRALDAAGEAVIQMSAVPSTDRIPALGGTATFTATLDNRPEVKRYHVEVVAR